jgi:type I restriction enzyme S subunit
MSNWKIYKLGEIAEVQNGYAFKSNDFSDKGIPIIKIKNIAPPRILFDDVEYYEGNINDKLKQFIIKRGDILISMTGSHFNQIASAVGKVGRYQHEFPALLNQRVGKLYVKDKTIFDENFFYYFISRPETQIDLVTSAGGSANQANISPSQIKNLELQLPPIQEQQSIAFILSSLDEKIEINLQMNQTLETMVTTIFKEWFIDFNFPGFNGKLVDGLPSEWKKIPIDESITFLNGIALQKYPATSETQYLPVIKIRELKQGINESSDKANLEIPKQYIVEDGDVLFSWSGSLEIEIWCGGKGALNQHLFKVFSDKFPKWFYYLWTKHYLPIYKSIAEGKVTTMGHIQRRHLTDSLINIPDEKTLKLADKIISPILERLIQNKIQIRTLTQIRDSLLPKLMTKKIEIK